MPFEVGSLLGQNSLPNIFSLFSKFTIMNVVYKSLSGGYYNVRIFLWSITYKLNGKSVFGKLLLFGVLYFTLKLF